MGVFKDCLSYKQSRCKIVAKVILGGALLLAPACAFAQDNADELTPSGSMQYMVEAQGSGSHGTTPLWLNANKYGLSSLKEGNGYARAAVSRAMSQSYDKKLDWGFCADIVVPVNYTSKFVIQQAYVEGRWMYGTLSIGGKQREMNLKNSRLSSGSQTLGISARPVPQVRLALEDYWSIPFTKDWLQVKGHVAFGMQTDEGWQHEFTDKKTRYSDNVLYHSKAGFLKIGRDGAFPLSVEMGLEMASLFGGNSYRPNGKGEMIELVGSRSFKAFWHAFVPGGKDSTDGENYKNAEGDLLGSWMMRVNYEKDTWKAGFYVDKFFEDHSAMFQLDYNGYGSGDEWLEKKEHKYVMYDFKDWMLGADFQLKQGTWLRNVVVEYLYTKYQSGPIYHDHTVSIPDHMGGMDSYYNHGIYPGWQHWGQVIGNPLYRSPIYNKNGVISVANNRFVALHVGVDGMPTRNIGYRVLASFQDGLGTYANPYTKVRHNVSVLVEGEYKFTSNAMAGWSVKGGYAMDFGDIIGDNQGFQLTIAKRGIIGKTKK